MVAHDDSALGRGDSSRGLNLRLPPGNAQTQESRGPFQGCGCFVRLLAEINAEMLKCGSFARGLKPHPFSEAFAARLKPCPCYKTSEWWSQLAFSQSCLASTILSGPVLLIVARHKAVNACPDTELSRFDGAPFGTASEQTQKSRGPFQGCGSFVFGSFKKIEGLNCWVG
jgi:hypothetical protein